MHETYFLMLFVAILSIKYRTKGTPLDHCKYFSRKPSIYFYFFLFLVLVWTNGFSGLSIRCSQTRGWWICYFRISLLGFNMSLLQQKVRSLGVGSTVRYTSVRRNFIKIEWKEFCFVCNWFPLHNVILSLPHLNFIIAVVKCDYSFLFTNSTAKTMLYNIEIITPGSSSIRFATNHQLVLFRSYSIACWPNDSTDSMGNMISEEKEFDGIDSPNILKINFCPILFYPNLLLWTFSPSTTFKVTNKVPSIATSRALRDWLWPLAVWGKGACCCHNADQHYLVGNLVSLQHRLRFLVSGAI